jgi:ABC-type transport system involved in cytochrome c biogenesis ATPase subunit
MQSDLSIAEPRIVCNKLSIRVDRSLLSGFSWEHRPGRIAWLVGSNGSGKSSLLRVLAGWHRPASGTIHWSGVTAAKVRYFNPAMSAGGDLRIADFVATIASLAPPSNDARVAALYPDTITASKRFGQLSTGEAKRVLLWALLLSGTGPLILDEPYEHISRDAKALLTEILRTRAVRDVVIIATNQDVPEQSGDSILMFDSDRIEVSRAP